MARKKIIQKALAALNFDLFSVESITPPAPATMYTKIEERAQPLMTVDIRAITAKSTLPTEEELYRLFE